VGLLYISKWFLPIAIYDPNYEGKIKTYDEVGEDGIVYYDVLEWDDYDDTILFLCKGKVVQRMNLPHFFILLETYAKLNIDFVCDCADINQELKEQKNYDMIDFFDFHKR